MTADYLKEAPLGQKSEYITTYTPELLFPIGRKCNRAFLGIDEGSLPFNGVDVWNCYELSWLDSRGKPVVALAQFTLPCSSPNIIESKSFKLFLNSLNQSRFCDSGEVKKSLERDLSVAAGEEVVVEIILPRKFSSQQFGAIEGVCLDDIEVDIETYEVDPTLLSVSETHTEETLYSYLLKSNCLKTGQPDWATLFIRYEGPQIDHSSLLKYIVSYRNHRGFHEDVVERMFVDLMKYCHCQKLTVYARYVRRGGLDINPFRSNFESFWGNNRETRQ